MMTSSFNVKSFLKDDMWSLQMLGDRGRAPAVKGLNAEILLRVGVYPQ